MIRSAEASARQQLDAMLHHVRVGGLKHAAMPAAAAAASPVGVAPAPAPPLSDERTLPAVLPPVAPLPAADSIYRPAPVNTDSTPDSLDTLAASLALRAQAMTDTLDRLLPLIGARVARLAPRPPPARPAAWWAPGMRTRALLLLAGAWVGLYLLRRGPAAARHHEAAGSVRALQTAAGLPTLDRAH
jgi:hypothetical protein